MINGTRGLRARGLFAPHIVVLAGIVAVMAVTFAVIILTLNRGFDWTDEGFVYAMIASNHVSTTEFWGFQYLLSPLYDLFGSSLLVFRILRLLGYVGLGVILTLIAHALLRQRGIVLGRVGWLLVGVVAQIGTFAAWSYPPRYLGYNELSSWLSQLGSAVLIFLLLDVRATRGNRASGRWWLWLIMGATLSVLFLAKISAGIVLMLLAIAAVLLVVGSDARWKRLAALLGGAIATFLLMLATGVPLKSFIATGVRLVADPTVQTERGYSTTTLLMTYFGSLSITVETLAIPILLAGVVLLVVRGLRVDGSPSLRAIVSAENVALIFAVVLAIVLTLASVFPGGIGRWASLAASNTFLLALALLSLAVLAVPVASLRGFSRRRTGFAFVFALGLFVIAPLISALGTNNPIFGQTVFSVTIWAVGAAVGLVVLWQRSEALLAAVRLLPVLLLGVIVTTSGLAVAGDVFSHPYRTTPYFSQKSMVEVGDLRGIRLTEGEAELYTWLHDVGMRQDAQGVPALSIASPGALLAFNASGWSAIWPGPAWASSIAEACSVDVPNNLFVLQAASEDEGMPEHDRLVEGLSACGISFPDDFELAEHHSSDIPTQDVRVWRRE